jgi:hypothetical protein
MNDDVAANPESWDPLASETDPGMLVAAQRREIRNILKSYTGYYDLFSELIQNALDAVERRLTEGELFYEPQISITIDLQKSIVSVSDNGCGMSEVEFRQFLRPNFSFKSSEASRGNKGVGATYLAYGFNHLEVATRQDKRTVAGIIRRGRTWVEDSSASVPRPKVELNDVGHEAFSTVDRGASMTVKLIGPGIRPRDLTWVGAQTAEQWLAVLRTYTPLGGVYLCGAGAPRIRTRLEVKDTSGSVTSIDLEEPRYLHPNEVMARVVDIREILRERVQRAQRGHDVSRIPPKYRALNGIWGEWTAEEILDSSATSPINVRSLEENEVKLTRELGIKLRIFLGYSTDLWDNYNDNLLKLRRGHRLLRGGLQLSTRNMPQGVPLTIPMTNNIGFQNLAHVLVHFENAEPDLGRKGFQPEVVRTAEKLSVAAVTALRRHYNLLKKPGGAKTYDDELKLDQWKQAQVDHERQHPLVISGPGLFMPTEELPIRSEPMVEQDVVALFNQMLSSGVVRGIQLISSSQYRQYDGLFRIKMERPFDRFILSNQNLLGIDADHFHEKDSLETVVKVLEYKFSVDGLIEELQAEVKAVEDVDLVVAWEVGQRWRQMFDATSYLDRDHVHLRAWHGLTHSFTHGVSGTHAFEAIILKDLVRYLRDPEEEETHQRQIVSRDEW